MKNKKKLTVEEIPEFKQDVEDAPEEIKIFVDKGIGICDKIHARLNQLKWTQRDFADKLGKNEEEISRNLGGLHNFTLKTIAKYEAVLGVELIEVNDFIEGKPNAELPEGHIGIYDQLSELQQLLSEKEKEIDRLKLELELYEQRDNDPYWYWPQCDVDECEGVSCNGGGAWRETGYWSVCSKHSNEFREGKPQPKMKQSAIEREASRDKETGYLPSVTESLKNQKQ